MIWLIALLVVRTTTLTYATHGSLSARFRPALALVIPALAMVVIPTLVVLDPDGMLSSLVASAPWALPLVAAVSGALVTRTAFAAIDREPAGSARASALETAAYALLANTLLDAALFVIATIAWVLASRSAYGH